MKTILIYHYESTDAAWARQIDEAFNRVLEFCPELRHVLARPPELTSFNRIVSGQFSGEDVRILSEYAGKVVERVRGKYAKPPFCDAPWAASVLQGAERMGHDVSGFVNWFLESGGVMG